MNEELSAAEQAALQYLNQRAVEWDLDRVYKLLRHKHDLAQIEPNCEKTLRAWMAQLGDSMPLSQHQLKTLKKWEQIIKRKE